MRIAVPLLVVLLLGVLGHPGAALGQQSLQDRANSDEAERAIAQLRSPYCPGAMLEVCTSYGGAMLRDSIYQLAAEGMSSDELVEWMVSRHGEQYRAVPPRTSFGLFSWIVPPAILLLGIVGVVAWLRANRAPETSVEEVPTELSAADREALSAAMRAWEDSGAEEI